MEFDYYDSKLSGKRLERCYELAPPRVRQYLEAEIAYALSVIPMGATVLELGCGYGRLLARLAAEAGQVCGIDTSLVSLCHSRGRLESAAPVWIVAMNAINTCFAADSFDCVLCLQNGISSFHVDRRGLMENAVELAKPGGTVLFSSYAETFWEHRLEWFRLQSAHGLVGEIDESATKDGTIICKDGFTATTLSPQEFLALARGLGSHVSVEIVDQSSVFCQITVGLT